MYASWGGIRSDCRGWGFGRSARRWAVVAATGLCVATATGISAGMSAPAQATTPVVRASFYYPWFPGGWNQQRMNPFTRYHPSDGFYSSTDTAVVAHQIAAMQYGHLDAGIISWWGQGSQTDLAVPMDLAAAAGTGFKWALYYEPEGYGKPSVAQIQSDLAYIKAHYTSDPSYLTIGGKPVLFVYASRSDRCPTAIRWQQANVTEGFYTVLKVFAGYASCSAQPSSWHQYAPSSATDHQHGYAFAVSPGFHKANQKKVRLARDLAAWNTGVQAMVASGEPLQLVTTFNEWGEGTAVESAQEWSSTSGYGSYIDILHNDIPAH